jgi:hypothetical protein
MSFAGGAISISCDNDFEIVVARYENRPTKKKQKMHSSTDRIPTTIAFQAMVWRNIDRCLFYLSIAPDSIAIFYEGLQLLTGKHWRSFKIGNIGNLGPSTAAAALER